MISLGDYLYRSSAEDNCTRQLIRAWLDYRTTVVGIKRVKLEDCENYGIVHGAWIESLVLDIDLFYEKPSIDIATKNMMIHTINGYELFGFFGLYIISNGIIREMVNADDSKEIGLTEYLSAYLKEHRVYGILIDGESFDVGNPKDYRETLMKYEEDSI